MKDIYSKKNLRRLAAALQISFFAGAVTMAPAAEAMPTGGVSATADLSNLSYITSNTTNNLITWETFSIGSGETVQFDSNNYLNYVVGNERSDILGTLKAGGDLYIINPNGVLFGKGATVEVGGLLYASTQTLSGTDLDSFTSAVNALGNAASGDIVNQGAKLTAMNITLEGDTITFAKLNTNQDAIANVTITGTDNRIKAIANSSIDIGYTDSAPSSINNLNNYNNRPVNYCVLITDEASLNGVTLGDTGVKYMLGSDINRTSTTSIGGTFNGLMNGAGYKVNLAIDESGTDYVGLFAIIGDDAAVRNLTLTGSVKGNHYVGALAGSAAGTDSGRTQISSVYNEANVSGSTNVGGIVGTANPTTSNYVVVLSNVSNSGTVAASSNLAGGIVGYMEDSRMTGASNRGAVSGADKVGGIVGNMEYGNAQVTSVYNDGTVSGSSQVGGIAGFVEYGGMVEKALNEGAVSSNNGIAGGIVGEIVNGSVTVAGNSGSVTSTGKNNVGGIAGKATGSTIEKTFNTGEVTGSSHVGGMAGYAEQNNHSSVNISNSFNTGNVIGTSATGGIVGYVEDSTSGDSDDLILNQVYNTGTVSGSPIVGAVEGSATMGYTTTAYYLDTSVSGYSDTSGNTVALTADQMKQQDSFTGWNMDSTGDTTAVWRIYNGHSAPLLTAFLTPLKLTDTSVAYDGNSHSLLASGYDNTKIKGSSYQGTAAGVYHSDLYSDHPMGYNIVNATLTIHEGVGGPAAPVTPGPENEMTDTLDVVEDVETVVNSTSTDDSDTVEQANLLKDKHSGMLVNSTHNVRRVELDEASLVSMLENSENDGSGMEFSTAVTGETETSATELSGYFDGENVGAVEA